MNTGQNLRNAGNQGGITREGDKFLNYLFRRHTLFQLDIEENA